MPTQQQVKDIVAEVRQQLKDASQTGVHLKVAGERLADDWLYVLVTPAKPGVRALDHANLMSKIERKLRKEGKKQVLLVPALDD